MSGLPHPWIPVIRTPSARYAGTVLGRPLGPGEDPAQVTPDALAAAWRRGSDPAVRALLSRADRSSDGRSILRRWEQGVHVTGARDLVDPLTEALRTAGFRIAERDHPGTVNVFVGRISPTTIQRWTSAARPHLVVSPRPSSIRVGPFVVPGRTACLQCLHLARGDRHPHWAQISEDLRRAPWPVPDPALVHRAAGLAALAVTGFAETGVSAAAGRMWTVDLDDPQTRITDVARHPLCGCWWPAVEAP
ncbi:MAG: TOMM precursor leader peptide-binding protein [Candidatus Nanopelagicales bacterium]